MNAPYLLRRGSYGRIDGLRPIEVDQLIELLEPYRGQNRRVLVRSSQGTRGIRNFAVDGDGDIILKGL